MLLATKSATWSATKTVTWSATWSGTDDDPHDLIFVLFLTIQSVSGTRRKSLRENVPAGKYRHFSPPQATRVRCLRHARRRARDQWHCRLSSSAARRGRLWSFVEAYESSRGRRSGGAFNTGTYGPSRGVVAGGAFNAGASRGAAFIVGTMPH